jgi:hypothetical protein
MGKGRSRYVDHVRSSDIIQPIKIDLDIYLEEDVYFNGMKTYFDTLEWWKCNALKYRILSKIVKDILVVLINTVTLESSFSASGRVIEPHRASLSPETIQMLLCGSDWVITLHGLKRKHADEVKVSYV